MFPHELEFIIFIVGFSDVYGEFRTQNMWIVLGLVVLFLFLLLSVILFCFYRKLRRKNLDLLQRIDIQNSIHVNKVEKEDKHVMVPVQRSGENRHHELFSCLEEYLFTDRNFAKFDIDTNRLVTELSTNRNYLFEAVKFTTGKTLQEYITTLRLEEAKYLLETTDEIIENIAELCGYSSVRTKSSEYKPLSN